MPIKPGQIYFLDRPRLRRATHGHPCLILRVEPAHVEICFLSTQFELKTGDDLTLNELDGGFSQTGLRESSYLVQSQIVTVPPSAFDNAQVLGCIADEVKQQVDDWYGIPLG
jgi:hypothetical protein